MHTSSPRILTPTRKFVEKYILFHSLQYQILTLSLYHPRLYFFVCNCVPLFDTTGGCSSWNTSQVSLLSLVLFLPFASRDEHTCPPIGQGGCRGVRTTGSVVVLVGVRVRVFSGSGGLKNIRITKRTQWFILVQANQCPMSSSWWPLYLKAPKIGGYNSVKRDLVGG
jgi:hypothetical protein